MNEPKRWSSAGSEVDPVLRSLLIHAREQRPSTGELQTILRGVSAAASPSKRRVPAFARGVALGLSLAGAGYAAGGLWPKPPEPAVVAPPDAPPSAKLEPRAPRNSAMPASAAVAAAPAPASARTSPPALRAVSSAAPTTADEEPARDAGLLQDARRIMLGDPARALTLTRDHELAFPESVLVEERQALRLEALARLGRHAEAQHELEGFEQRFPRSIYRRRLQSLLAR